jgi:choline dehydrogenase-like flavoprotein
VVSAAFRQPTVGSRTPSDREAAVAADFDVIIVGTGAGGGTLANTLAPSGKRILLLERGDFLTRELGNWDPAPVFVDGRYIALAWTRHG